MFICRNDDAVSRAVFFDGTRQSTWVSTQFAALCLLGRRGASCALASSSRSTGGIGTPAFIRTGRFTPNYAEAPVTCRFAVKYSF